MLVTHQQSRGTYSSPGRLVARRLAHQKMNVPFNRAAVSIPRQMLSFPSVFSRSLTIQNVGKNGAFKDYYRALAKGIKERGKPETSEGIPGPGEALKL